MKKSNLKKTWLLLYVFDKKKKNSDFEILEHFFWSTLPCLHPNKLRIFKVLIIDVSKIHPRLTYSHHVHIEQ